MSESSFVDAYFNWLYTFKGEPVRQWMLDHLEVPVVAVSLYFVLVLWIPENFMKNREPYNLKYLNILWNLLLTVFSFMGAYHTLPRVFLSLFSGSYELEYEFKPGVMEVCDGTLQASICSWNGNLFFNGPAGAYVMLFILSKIPEMIDTVFLVFQKKRLIFLHWYHHITVMLYCWHSYTFHIGTGLIFASMNYGVHSIMYLYYFICALGYRKLVRPFAIYITLLQIIQMVIGLFVELASLYYSYAVDAECKANRTNIRLGAVMYFSYFILFSQMFIANYASKKTSGSGRRVEGGQKNNGAVEANGNGSSNGSGATQAAGKKRQ